MTMDKIATDFAKELGNVRYRELANKILGMSFKQAFVNLGGYNLDENEGFFDCNYKEISITIWRDKFNGCYLNRAFDVWHGDISTPIVSNATFNN